MKEFHMMGCTDLVTDWWSDCWSDMLAAWISNQQAELITDSAVNTPSCGIYEIGGILSFCINGMSNQNYGMQAIC